MPRDTYTADAAEWARSIEFVASPPTPEVYDDEFIVDPDAKFLIAVATTPEGARPAWLNVRLEVTDPNGTTLPDEDNDRLFFSRNDSLLILNDPPNGRWTFRTVSNRRIAYTVNAQSFHPSAPPPPPPGGLRCKVCKITAKALAAAIVAAGSLAVMPAALTAAVASFLATSPLIGQATAHAMAAAFIIAKG